MADIKMPAFTAERSLEIFIQQTGVVRTGTDRGVIIPAMRGGCCHGFCTHPCTGGGCTGDPGECCCKTTG
jgi:hypothetical protein